MNTAVPMLVEHGYLELVTRSSFSGWAQNTTAPASPVHIDLYDGEILIRTIPADLTRNDLLAHGLQTGGFYCQFDQKLPPGAVIRALIHETGKELIGSPVAVGMAEHHQGLYSAKYDYAVYYNFGAGSNLIRQLFIHLHGEEIVPTEIPNLNVYTARVYFPLQRYSNPAIGFSVIRNPLDRAVSTFIAMAVRDSGPASHHLLESIRQSLSNVRTEQSDVTFRAYIDYLSSGGPFHDPYLQPQLIVNSPMKNIKFEILRADLRTFYEQHRPGLIPRFDEFFSRCDEATYESQDRRSASVNPHSLADLADVPVHELRRLLQHEETLSNEAFLVDESIRETLRKLYPREVRIYYPPSFASSPCAPSGTVD